VGRWVLGSAEKNESNPGPAIRAKAAELTKGMTDERRKAARPLYNFVSTKYRLHWNRVCIGTSINRMRPMMCSAINYGDCKDKHTLAGLLACRLPAFTLYPALISSGWKLDPEVPSAGAIRSRHWLSAAGQRRSLA